MADKPRKSTTRPTPPEKQRDALLEAERKAKKAPRAFKEDALTEKQVRVEPDGTGPTSTGSFDTDEDRRRGSGSDPGAGGATPGPKGGQDPGR